MQITVPKGHFPLRVGFYVLEEDAFICDVPTPGVDGIDIVYEEPLPGIGVDNFQIPAGLLPLLVSEFGEPDEFLDRVFMLPLGKDIVSFMNRE